MASTIKGCRIRILVGGVDLSGDTSGVGVSIAGRTLDYGVLQDCSVRSLALPPKATIEHNGYYTGNDTTQIAGALNAHLASTTGVHVAAIFATDEAVPFAYVQDLAYNSKLGISGKVGSLITVSGTWPTLSGIGAQMYRGYQVYGGAVTTTGAVTGIDFGAAGAAGGKAYIFVTSITGTATGASIKIQSDSNADHSTTADEGTATFSAVGCQEVDLSGVVGRYVRANVVGLGGATGFTFYAIVCLSGVTY